MTESDDYKRGWYDGYQAAQKDSTRIYPTQPLPTTSPFPSNMDITRCNVCGLDTKRGAWGYVCYQAGCPTKVTCSVNVNSFADNNMSMLKPEIITTLKTTGEIK